MSIQRKQIDAVKIEAKRLLQRIDEMERCAGWSNYETPCGYPVLEPTKPHPKDYFNGGQYTGAVKRASLDLSRAMVAIRR